jgi:lipopolysaccharide assembly outer membrane protein LptD (OstA)
VSRFLHALLMAGLALPAAPAWAQDPPPEEPAGAAVPAPPGGEPAPAPGDVRVRAESYEQVAKGKWQARGMVDLRLGDLRLQADRADVFEETAPDGTVHRRLVAEGNVVFIRGVERLSGDRVEMDDTGRGVFDNAVGFVEPGVFVEGRRIFRVDADTYRVEGGKFTSCAQPSPRWSFTASKATIDVDDKITATNALFKVKGVPAFYLPYVYYPISRDGRSTGLLFPHFGYSSYRGFNTGTGFFWVMGRSADQTFYADYYSKLGYGFGHELRYLRKTPSRGTFRTYLFRLRSSDPVIDPGTGEVITEGQAATTDYDIDWNALEMLPGKVRATLNVRQYSNLSFNQRFQDNFNMVTNRTKRWSGALDKDLGLAVLSVYADTTNTYFGTDFTRVNGRVPGASLRRFPRQVGLAGIVFGLEASAERIRYGTETQVDDWARYDVAPVLSRPFRVSFLEFNPSVGYRYTRYGASYGVDEDGESAIVGPPLDRSFFETSVELRGPTFARVFDTPGFGYSERFKHTIGPEVSWTYRTRVEDFNSIPKFDGDDYFLGTDQIAYSLVQRFYAKRRGPTGKALPYEFFLWRLMQTYYVQIADGQNNFDPNYSSSAFGPGFKPEHLSPLMSRMRFRPTPAYSIDFNVEYDVNFKQVRRTSVTGSLNLPRAAVAGGWSRSYRLSEDPAQRIVGSHTLRGNASMEVVPKRLFLEGSADYDVVNDILWQARGQLRYAVQCCGFVVEYIRYNWNGRDEKQWRFNLELANIGSMGNFLGADTGNRSQGLGGYR